MRHPNNSFERPSTLPSLDDLRKDRYQAMLEMLKTIKDIAQDHMPKSSAYLRHDSNLYNQDKVDIYELCKSISEKCHMTINKVEKGELQK